MKHSPILKALDKISARLTRASTPAEKDRLNAAAARMISKSKEEKALAEKLDQYLDVPGEALPGPGSGRTRISTPRETHAYFLKRFSEQATA